MRKRSNLIIACLFAIAFVLCLTAYSWAGTKTITLAWNQTIKAGFGGWKVYMSTSPNVAVTPTNLFVTIPYGGTPASTYVADKDLTSPDGQLVTYYFRMTAYGTNGAESGPSNEASVAIDFRGQDAPYSLTVVVKTP